MNNVLEFPSKIFVQWGAIAQEMVPYLAQRGASPEEIRTVIDRVRMRWDQPAAAPGHGAGDGSPLERPDRETAGKPGEQLSCASRHWRLQPARMLIEFAAVDFQRHSRR